MMIRRWIAGAVTVVVVGGFGYLGEVGAAMRVPAETTAKDGAHQLRIDDAALTTMAASAASAAPIAAHKSDAWEAESLEEDPANLRGERVRPVEQEPLVVDRGAAGLEQMLRKLRTRASLMMIVAHPDDEDGGMLAYESRGQGVRVGMLTLTRGEGGQNVVTGDFDDALGLVRTRELLAADRYMGVDQMFGTEVDFGFSKTKEEAFEKWTHERVLYDAVRAVRLYRPLVVASVFIGAPTDGHGQHQVAGEMAQEVFTAAANPNIFPEMGLPVWAPAKVYGRMPFAQVNEKGMFDYATGKYVPARFYNYVTKTWSNDAPKADVTVPEGEYSAALGKSYVQFAREGLALQRTQIGGGARLAPRGRFDVGYTRYGAARGIAAKGVEAGFFDGLDTSLMGLMVLAPSLRGVPAQQMDRGLEHLDGTLERATEDISKDPAKAAPLLRDGLGIVDDLIEQAREARDVEPRERYNLLHELRIKRVQFNDALVVALGLEARAELQTDAMRSSGDAGLLLVPGSAYKLQFTFRSSSLTPLEVTGCHMRQYAPPAQASVETTSGFCQGVGLLSRVTGATERTTDGNLPANAMIGRMPFTKKNVEQPYYDVRDAKMRNAALPPPAMVAWMDLKYGGVPLSLGRVVGKEQAGVYQPLSIVPGLSVSVSPAAGVVPLNKTNFLVTVRVKSAEQGGAQGLVQLQLPAGWRSEPNAVEFQTIRAGEERAIPIRVTPGPLGERAYTLTARAMWRRNGKEYREGYRAVGYPGLVRDNLYSPATYRTRGVDVRVPSGLRVAYLPGTGDAVEASLEDIGIQATTMSVADIAAGRLAAFDTLIMGVRAYAAQKSLPAVTGKLTDFATSGGVVVVQYQSSEYQGEDAPYPLSLGGAAEKVVEEEARVQLLLPAAQVLSWPNKISEKDFGGWVEERGHGFAAEWDSQYEAVTEVHDAGQNPQKGGLLVSRVGKGAYVYCAYALYRQMPEGVPGAFRLMANMVSLGRRP